MEVRPVAPFCRWSIAFAIDITTCSLSFPSQRQPEHWPKALGRRNTFKAISLWLHVCSGLQLALTPSWQVQKVKTLLDGLFLRGINLLLKDLSAGNCEVGEGLYLNRNWSFRVHTVTWSFIYILCTYHQGEEDACGTITSLNVVWSSDYLIGRCYRDFIVQLMWILLLTLWILCDLQWAGRN